MCYNDNSKEKDMNMNIEKIKSDIAKLDESALDQNTANNLALRDFFERLVAVLSHMHGRIIELEEQVGGNITTDLNEKQFYQDELFGVNGEFNDEI